MKLTISAVQEIMGWGEYAGPDREGSLEPDFKDFARMEAFKIDHKNPADIIKACEKMAKLITKKDKAIRRAKAAQETFKGTTGQKCYDVFMKRSKQLHADVTAAGPGQKRIPDTAEWFEVDVSDDDAEATLRLSKVGGKWQEKIIENKDNLHIPNKNYMGYLKPRDILDWLRKDFDYVDILEFDNESSE